MLRRVDKRIWKPFIACSGGPIKIFPKKFSLKIFGDIYKVSVLKLEEGIAGLCSPQTKQILIATNQSKEDAIHTLIHEVGHSVCARTGVRQANFPIDLEEILVENFATAICENFNLSLKGKKKG